MPINKKPAFRPVIQLTETSPEKAYFKPVVDIPCTIYFWNITNIIRIGSSDKVPIAKIAGQSVADCGSENILKAKDTVYSFGLFR